MSAGLPYLSKLRKSDLTELAETSKLSDYASLKKAELEVALDEHLRANQTTYANEPSFGDYYKRLGSSSRSPMKKIADKVTEMVKSDDDEGQLTVVKKAARRKTVSPAEEKAPEAEGSYGAVLKTPGKEIARKSSSFAASIPAPPSPAVVADAIDRQTNRIRASISEVYKKSQITEYSDYTRELLSSPLAIDILALAIEAYGLRKEILPSKAIGDIPAIKYFKDTKTTVYVPDLFLLLGPSFWAPFSLWLLTSLVLPLALAYFVNLPLKTHPTHNYSTRRATSVKTAPEIQFDPFVYNIAKALLAYVVYAEHFQLFGLFSNFTVATVNENVLGGWFGIVTGAGIGGLISLYEAVLKK